MSTHGSTTSTHQAWSQSPYAEALRKAEHDAQTRRVIAPPAITRSERVELLRYVRSYAQRGGYERLVARVNRFETCPYHLNKSQWDMLDECHSVGVIGVGRGNGPTVEALLGIKLLQLVSVGRYALTEMGKKVVEGTAP